MADEPTVAEPQTTEAAPAAPQQTTSEPAAEVNDAYAKSVLDSAYLNLPGAKEFMEAAQAEPKTYEQVAVTPEHPSQPSQQSIVEGELRDPNIPTPIQPVETKPEIIEPQVQAAPVTDDEVVPPSTDRAAQEKWDRLRRGYKEAQQLKGELETYKQQAVQAEAWRSELEQAKQYIDAARQEREAIEGELYRGRVVATQTFQKQVAEPYKIITQAAQHLAKESELDADALTKAIVNGDKKGMIEMTAGLHTYDQTKVYTMFDDMRRVDYARQNLIKNSKAAQEAYVRDQQAQQQHYVTEVLETRNRAVGELAPKFTERLTGIVPQERMPDMGVISKAAIGFENWSEPVKMFSAFASVILPEVLEQTGSLQAQLKAAQSEITRLRGAAPRTDAGQPVTQVAKPTTNGTYQAPKPGETFDPLRLAQGATDRIRQSLGWTQ